MICKNCGKEIQEGLMFCPGCGNLADSGKEAAVPTVETAGQDVAKNDDTQQAVSVSAVNGTDVGASQVDDSGNMAAGQVTVDHNMSQSSAPQQGNAGKKSPVPWIIAGVGAVVLVAAVVVVAVVVLAGALVARNNQGLDEQGDNITADNDGDGFPGDGSDTGADTTGDTGTGSSTDTGDSTGHLPDDLGSGLDTKADIDILEKYCKDELISGYGIFDMDQMVELGYFEKTYDGYTSPAYSSFDDSVEGIMTHKIADFDNDMRSEMLVVRMEHSTVWIEMYEVDALSRVSRSASMPVAVIGAEVDNSSALDYICGDIQELNICVNEYGNEKYIAADCMGDVCLFADGIDNVLYISHYDGKSFVQDFNESFCGSDDYGMDIQVQVCKSGLKDLGFLNTADSFTFLSMQLADEKGMERLVGLRGENSLVYEGYSETNDYYITNDINCLGTIKYLFAEGGKVTHKRFESAYATDYHSINNNSEYILPGSDSRYYTMDELAGLTAEECRLARNELFARHGRKFQDEALQAYFDSLSWYHGTIDPEDFDESIFNEYEVANRDLIVQYEKDMGYR